MLYYANGVSSTLHWTCGKNFWSKCQYDGSESFILVLVIKTCKWREGGGGGRPWVESWKLKVGSWELEVPKRTPGIPETRIKPCNTVMPGPKRGSKIWWEYPPPPFLRKTGGGRIIKCRISQVCLSMNIFAKKCCMLRKSTKNKF